MAIRTTVWTGHSLRLGDTEIELSISQVNADGVDLQPAISLALPRDSFSLALTNNPRRVTLNRDDALAFANQIREVVAMFDEMAAKHAKGT